MNFRNRKIALFFPGWLLLFGVLSMVVHAEGIEKRNGGVINLETISGLDADRIRRLSMQHRIDWNLPFRRALLVGTHNSYSAEDYSSYDGAFNQYYDVTAQLNAGARILNFDLILNTYEGEIEFLIDTVTGADSGSDIIVCHGVQFNSCIASGKRYLFQFLEEVRIWIDKNPDEVVVIQFEVGLSGNQYTQAAELLRNRHYLGDKYFRPGQLGITDFRDLSKDSIRSAGKNIVFTCGGCGNTTNAWDLEVFNVSDTASLFHKGSDWWKLDNNIAHALLTGVYDSRYDKDPYSILHPNHLSWLLHTKQYNVIGLDYFFEERQLSPFTNEYAPDSERFDALVWSWAEGYPNAKHECTMHSNISGRVAGDVHDLETKNTLVEIEESVSFFGIVIDVISKLVPQETTDRVEMTDYEASDQWASTACSTVAPVACAALGQDGYQVGWSILTATSSLQAHHACAARGMVFRAPQTAFENLQLTRVKRSANIPQVLINYRKLRPSDSSWKVADRQDVPMSILSTIIF